jgi:hypothetical protein
MTNPEDCYTDLLARQLLAEGVSELYAMLIVQGQKKAAMVLEVLNQTRRGKKSCLEERFRASELPSRQAAVVRLGTRRSSRT